MPATLPGTEDHPHARAVLAAAIPPAGSASHAYLFHGPAGSGKREVARELAAALLADGATDPDEAAARVRSGAHPDLTWVTPSGAAEMLVADIDEPVVAAATRTPFESRRRVFVIERADAMTDPAANRMLKTLEEPPAFAHLILLTNRLSEVLPTIASRCQHVRFDARPPQAIADRLGRHGIAPETATACARLSLGDGERALALALGTGPAIRDAAERYARAAMRDDLVSKPWSALLAQAKAAGDQAAAEAEGRTASDLEYAAKRDRKRVERDGGERAKRAQRRAATAALDLGLQLTGLWLRDLAALADGAPEVVLNTDRREALAQDAQRASSVHALREAVELVDDCRFRLQLNVTDELALEALAYRLAERLA
ncbi:MAG TPA: hypothetical protein VIL49_02495 [Capillimicrobium sp.]|jgi:DNA polymerase-3 subunit delta'